jgi:hypothetical protein
MSGTRNLEGLKTLASKCIEKAYDKGYKSGLKDGNINDGTFAAKVKEAYNNGLNDVEKAVRRLVVSIADGGLTPGEKQMIFGLSQDYVILTNFSMSEIVKKIREYDERKHRKESTKDNDDEIHIGDEIYILSKNHSGIVTALLDSGNKANILCASGNYSVVEISELHKTGRRFAIDEVLRKLKE